MDNFDWINMKISNENFHKEKFCYKMPKYQSIVESINKILVVLKMYLLLF